MALEFVSYLNQSPLENAFVDIRRTTSTGTAYVNIVISPVSEDSFYPRNNANNEKYVMVTFSPGDAAVKRVPLPKIEGVSNAIEHLGLTLRSPLGDTLGSLDEAVLATGTGVLPGYYPIGTPVQPVPVPSPPFQVIPQPSPTLTPSPTTAPSPSPVPIPSIGVIVSVTPSQITPGSNYVVNYSGFLAETISFAFRNMANGSIITDANWVTQTTNGSGSLQLGTSPNQPNGTYEIILTGLQSGRIGIGIIVVLGSSSPSPSPFPTSAPSPTPTPVPVPSTQPQPVIVDGTFTKLNHGFQVGDAIYLNRQGWFKGLNTARATLAYYLVSAIVDVNRFKVAEDGEVVFVPNANYVFGSWYHLSPTIAGRIEPVQDVAFSLANAFAQNPIGQAVSPQQLKFTRLLPVIGQ